MAGDPRSLLASAGIAKLFDVIVDQDVQGAFALRPCPAPDALLKLCTDMAVSPYETIGLFSLHSGSIPSARNASLGLVVGIPQGTTCSSQSCIDQSLKLGADEVVTDIGQLQEPALYTWYQVCRVRCSAEEQWQWQGRGGTETGLT